MQLHTVKRSLALSVVPPLSLLLPHNIPSGASNRGNGAEAALTPPTAKGRSAVGRKRSKFRPSA